MKLEKEQRLFNIGSAISGGSSVLWNFPAIEVGSIVATTMFIFMLIAIFKSGQCKRTALTAMLS